MIGCDRSAAILRIRRCIDNDPAMSWCFVLLVELISDLNDVVVELSDICNDDRLEERVKSLETRYSECLYYLKDKNK